MTINTKENPKILNDFLTYLYAVKGYSSNTISTYNFYILQFLKFILAYWNMPIKTKDVTVFILINVKESDIMAYLTYLNYTRDNSPSTRKNKVDALRTFYKWIFNSYPTISNKNLIFLPKIQQQFRLPKYLSFDKSCKIQNIFNISNSRFHVRDNLIITLFLHTGMRLSELVNINIRDIDFNKKTINIIGKGDKERIVYLNNYCVKKIKEYLKTRMKNNKIINIQEALFINKNGQRLQQHGVEYICKKAFKLAGLADYNYTAHSLRHTAATQLYMNTEDLLIVKGFLGHSSITSTEIYSHIHNSIVKNAVDKNPLANFKCKNSSEREEEGI